jgi:hypothetical protein
MKTIDSTDPSLASLPSVQASVSASIEDDDDRLDRIRLLKEYAREFAAECDNDVFAQAATNMAIVDLYSILNRFDTAKLSKRLEKNPELYFKLIKSFCEFSRLGLERDKFEWKKKQVEERKLARERKLPARNPIVINLATIAPAMLSIATLCEGSAQPEAPVPTESNAASPEPSIGPRVGVHALARGPQTVTSDTALTDTIKITETLSPVRQPTPADVRFQFNYSQMDSPHEYIEELPESAMNTALVAGSPP